MELLMQEGSSPTLQTTLNERYYEDAKSLT